MGKFLQTVAELACLKTMLIVSNLAFWVSFNDTLEFASIKRKIRYNQTDWRKIDRFKRVEGKKSEEIR